MQTFLASSVSVFLTTTSEENIYIVQQSSLGKKYFSRLQLRFQVLLDDFVPLGRGVKERLCLPVHDDALV